VAEIEDVGGAGVGCVGGGVEWLDGMGDQAILSGRARYAVMAVSSWSGMIL